MSDRHYANPYLSWPVGSLDERQLYEDLHRFVGDALPFLEAELDSHRGDFSLYTGKVGVALTVWRVRRFLRDHPLGVSLAEEERERDRERGAHTHTFAHTYSFTDTHTDKERDTDTLSLLPPLEVSRKRLSSHGLGFCCESLCFRLYSCLCRGEEFVVESDWLAPDERGREGERENELLNGRAGLALLLDLFCAHGLRVKPEDSVQRVLQAVDLSLFPWAWRESVYFGAAHGTAGILLALQRLLSPTHGHGSSNNNNNSNNISQRPLSFSRTDSHMPSFAANFPTQYSSPRLSPRQASRDREGERDSERSSRPSSLSLSSPRSNRSSLARTERERLSREDLVICSLTQRLVSLAQLPSGNFKSSADSDRDRLVQWCHGAPGFVPLLLCFSERETSLQPALARALEVIWQRGLLEKGAGLCHGIAGNGYAFLAHTMTHWHEHGTLEEVSLFRALCFAREIVRHGVFHCCEKADHPHSLFEGLAGSVQFLLDVLTILRERLTRSLVKLQHWKLLDGLQIF